MKTLILLALLTIPALAQQSGWQSPDALLISRPDEQAAAIKRLRLPADCIVLMVSLDCSDCVRPLEVLRGNKSAVVVIRARTSAVESWKRRKPTAARVVAIDTDEADKDWFDLGVFGLPTVLKIEGGRIVGAAESLPSKF